MRVAFVDVAVWWIVFTLPMFRYVSEPPPTDEQAGWRELWATIRSVLRDRPVLNFLLAYWLYIDGISTVQIMATDFGSKLGFSSSALIQALLLVQFIAFPFALLFGRLGDRIGTKRAIYLGLAVFVAITIYAYFMRSEWQFYVLAAAFGTVQGGVQALSRSYFTHADSARARRRVLRLLQHAGEVCRGAGAAGHGSGRHHDRQSAAVDPGADAVLRRRRVVAVARTGVAGRSRSA